MSRHTPQHRYAASHIPNTSQRSLAFAMQLLVLVGMTSGWTNGALAQQAKPAQRLQAGASDVRNYNIASGPLNQVLMRFLGESGVLLSGSTELTQGQTSPGVRGRYSSGAALAALLNGTGVSAVSDERGRYVLQPVSVDAPSSAAGASSTDVARLAPITAVAVRSGDLPEVYAGGQVARGARLGLLGNVDVMDTPFTVTSFTADAIENRSARTVADVLRSDPSVRFSTSDGHPFENFRIRNFAVNQNEMTINGMYGMAPYGHTPVEMFERIELLRGPSALFTGMAPAGALGGTINLVPKRAGEEPLNRVSVGWQSKGNVGTRFDLSRRFGEDKALGIRLNGSFSDGNTALEGQSKQRQFLSAALDYRNGGFKGSFDAYYSREKFKGGTPAGIFFRNANLGILTPPDADTQLFPAAYGDAENTGAIARAEYAFNDHVSAYANVGYREGKVKGFYTGTWAVVSDADGSASLSMSGQRMYEKTLNTEAGMRFNFNTGSIAHDLTLQASRLKMDYGYDATSNAGTTNIYNPSYVDMPQLPGYARKWSDKYWDSLALVDTMSMFDDRLKLTLGLRHQRFRVDPTANGIAVGGEADYNETAVTPAVGIVFKPWGDNISLYGSYVQGLSQGDSISTTSGFVRNHTFAPYKTEQIEAGIKWNLGTFTNTLALYQITKPTLLTFNTAAGLDATDGGEKRVRGLEWNTFGEIMPGLRVLGGVVYSHAVQTKTQDGLLDGYTAVGAPRWQGNIGAEWDVPRTNGLTLTAGMQATSGQWLTNDHTLKLPGWAVFDVGARYSTNLSGRKTVFRFNVENVGNRNYYSGIFREGAAIATMGAARTFSASMSMEF